MSHSASLILPTFLQYHGGVIAAVCHSSSNRFGGRGSPRLPSPNQIGETTKSGVEFLPQTQVDKNIQTMPIDEALKAAFFLESERHTVTDLASVGIGPVGQVLKVTALSDDTRRVLIVKCHC